MKLLGDDSSWLVIMMVIMVVTDTECRNELSRPYVRSKRAINPLRAIRNWWTGNSEKRLVPLGQHPLWKVHKYNGISLNPVAVVDSTSAGIGGPLPEMSGTPPPVVKVPHATYSPSDELEPPKTSYDPPSYTAAEQYEPRQPVYSMPQATYLPPKEYGPPSPVYHASQQTFSLPEMQGSSGSSSNQVDSGTNSIDTTEEENFDSGSEGDTAAALSALDSIGPLTSLLDGSESGGLDLGTLAKIATSLPDGSVEKLVALLDLYNAKNNQERLSAFNDAASASFKLKAGAANTAAHFVEDVFLGNNGDNSNVAMESGTYSNVPSDYPGRPGILPMIPPLSGLSWNVPLPKLPEPPTLPNIPLLKGVRDLIKPPNLPYIYFPATYTLPDYKVKGPYVSIRLPKPVTTYSIPNKESPSKETSPKETSPKETSPKETLPTENMPKETSSSETFMNTQQYEAPSESYKPPYPEAATSFNEVQTYPLPSTPAPVYGAPASASYSVSQADSSSFQPSPATSYGIGDVMEVPMETYGPPQNYGVPQTYGPPQIDSVLQTYGVPQPDNTPQTYGVPQNDNVPPNYNPPQTYSVPQTYGPPQTDNVPQTYSAPQTYGPPQADNVPQTYSAPQTYGPPQTDNVPQTYSAPQTYGPPQTNNVPQTYSAPQTYGPPQTDNVPQTYSAPQTYGAPQMNSTPQTYGVPQTYSVSQEYGPPQVGFDHNKYSPQKFSVPSTGFGAANDITAAATEHKAKVIRSAQELKTGYSRVFHQNRPAKSKENNSKTFHQENSNVDLSMYLDRNHPASTQELHEQNMGEENINGQEVTKEINT